MEGSGLQATIHCEKHKDVPAGCDHHFALIPHTVSPELMPNTFEPYRSTLVISNATTGLQTLRANSQRVVLEIIWNSAPPEGFTGSQVIELAKPMGVGKSSVYLALKTLVEEGFARNVGTPRRSRYVRGERQP